MKYGYARERVLLRNPTVEEDALLVNVEFWTFHTAMRFPSTRETPVADAVIRSRFIVPPTFTRFAVAA